MRRRNSRHNIDLGFTLVEILVAVTIFAVIAAGIAGVLSSGLKVWSRARSTDFSQGFSMLALDTAAREIRQAAVMPGVAQAAWEGAPAEFYLTVVSKDSVSRIGYKFDAGNKTLIRKEAGLKDLIAKEGAGYIEKEVLSIDELSFSFLGKEQSVYTWTDTWPKEKGAFKAVRLKGKIKNEEFVKTIFIPAS